MGRRRCRVTVVTGLAAVILSGCFWSNPGYGPQGSGYNPHVTGITPTNVGSLTEAWHRDWSGTSALPVVESRAGLHTVVNATGEEPTAVGLAPSTGAVEWSTTVPRVGGTAEYAADDLSTVGADLAVSSAPNYSYGSPATTLIDPATGTIDDSDISVGSHVTADGAQAIGLTVYPSAPDGFSYVQINAHPLDAGVAAFSFEGVTDPSSVGSYPALSRDKAFVSVGSTFAGLKRDPGVADCPVLNAPDTSPCIFGGHLFSSQLTDPVVSPDGSTVFVVAGTTLYALDVTQAPLQPAPPAGDEPTFPIRWQASLTGGTHVRPALSPDGLVVATDGGAIEVFDPAGCGAATCTPDWTTTVPGSVSYQPTIAGGVIYVASAPDAATAATISAFPAGCATGCAPLWTTDTGLVLSGSVVVSGRNLVFASGSVVGDAQPTARVVAYRPS